MLASASTAWVANTLSAIIPYRIECAPVPLLPTVPPTVARLPLAGSGPSIRPCGRSAALRWSSTTPGWQRTQPASGSI